MTSQIIEIGGFILGSITALGICAGGFGFLVSKYKDGKNKSGNDILQSSSTLLNYLQNENAEYKKMASAQNDKITTLTANNTFLEKKVEELKAIVDGRDPNTKNFQDAMLAFIKQASEYQMQSAKILGMIVEEIGGLKGSHEEIKAMVQEPKSIHIEGSAKMS